MASMLTDGVFYFPAWKRYGHKCQVRCTRCSNINLPCCVSVNDKNLCMTCVHIIANHLDHDDRTRTHGGFGVPGGKKWKVTKRDNDGKMI